MRKLPFYLTAMAVLLTPTLAQADDHEDNGYYLSMSEFTLKTGHIKPFGEGAKAWLECYNKAGGEKSYNLWRRLQGNGHVAVLTSAYKDWQAFFSEDEAAKKCEKIVDEQITPHMESTAFHMAGFMPKWSGEPGGSDKYVAVYNFKVADYELFESTVEAIEAAVKDDGGPDSHWYYSMGGRGVADYFVVEGFADAAELDADDPGIWKRVEAKLGAEKKDQLQGDFMKSINEWWTYMYIHLEDLSYAGKTE
ncbi:hypothetical protein [Pseudidiomarina homiensis]|uniref:Uncharacterized protein n=1 Tax=Pseudidiomarina homiensis TaxID=364198 RepID=A0A432XU63_9GAMM|nr:hypothetical protein [Pseudidiomarina homiensis]RUO52267.1 hypothetical protein CWI70_11080 [Pseudidiomarina homiensis]